MKKPLIYIEIEKKSLIHNIGLFRKLIGNDIMMAACVKSNAYGHGLIETSKIFLEAGSDWLSMVSIEEALALREQDISAPVLLLGYVPIYYCKEVVQHDISLVVYNTEIIDALDIQAKSMNKKAKVHLKVETGLNRQGLSKDELLKFAQYIQTKKNIIIEGIYTHYANIEDTTDDSYSKKQLQFYTEAITSLENHKIHIPIKHTGNSASTILYPETYFNLVRPGISCYGYWPSETTYLSYIQNNENKDFLLKPALSLRTHIVQIKQVEPGEYIGYGLTYQTTHATRIAILPLGYYDGYDRKISNIGYVLIHGKRAPIRGRVFMNMLAVDVTDIPQARENDIATLIGKDADQCISVEQVATWSGTINYEVVARLRESIPRIYI